LYPTGIVYTYFSTVHGVFPQNNYVLGHTESFNKTIEMAPISFYQTTMEWNPNSITRETIELLKHRETKQFTIEWSVVHRRKKGEIKRFLHQNDNENTIYQNIGNTSKAVLRAEYSYEC
jgi:hypothetical protein